MKNLLKTFGIIALAVIIGFSFFSCDEGEDEIHERYHGDLTSDMWLAETEDDYDSSWVEVSIKVEAKKISWTGDTTGSLTKVSTSGGGTFEGRQWDYLYVDGTKFGVIIKNNNNLSYNDGLMLYTGRWAREVSLIWLNSYLGTTLDFTDVREYPSIDTD